MRLLLILSLLLAGCLVQRPDDRPTPIPTTAHTPVEAPVLEVVAARAVTRTLSSQIEALGTVAPARSANLGSDVSGRVLEMNVDLGDPVHAGQVLASLDTRDARLQANVSRAQLGESVAKVGLNRKGKLLKPTEVPAVQKARANMDNAFKAYDDYRKLRAEDLISRRSLEDKRSSYLQAKADYESALEQVRQDMASIGTSQATHAQDEAKIAEAVLRAPFDGFVQEKGIDVGDYVTAGSPTGLMIMARNPLYVMLDVPQQETRRVQEGRRLTFTCDAYPEQRLQAVVSRIAPALSPTSRALSVKARVDNAPGWLRPGMAVKAELATGSPRKQILVPAAAVLTQSGRSRVFVIEGDVVKSRPVTILERMPGWVVVEGVRPGHRVATSDLLGMRDGTRVKVTRELPAPRL